MGRDGRKFPMMPETERQEVIAANFRLDKRTRALHPEIVETAARLYATEHRSADAYLAECGISFTEDRARYMSYERAVRAAGLALLEEQKNEHDANEG